VKSFLHKSHAQQHLGDVGAEGAEDQAVRQYRYLLRSAPSDALEAAHIQALSRLSEQARAGLLRTVQDVLVTGTRLTLADHQAIGHLMTLGELRSPGVLLAAYPPDALHALAIEVIGAEAVFGLFGGYAAWDGRDPEPVEEVAEVVEHPGRGEDRFNIVKGFAEGGFGV
jgi:hypothetical protein